MASSSGKYLDDHSKAFGERLIFFMSIWITIHTNLLKLENLTASLVDLALQAIINKLKSKNSSAVAADKNS
jgi:hypothetical protein